MLPVFSVVLEYRMNGRNSSARPTVRPQSACAFCTLAISKQTKHVRLYSVEP